MQQFACQVGDYSLANYEKKTWDNLVQREEFKPKLGEFGGPDTGEPPGDLLPVIPVFLSVLRQEQPLLIAGDNVIEDGHETPDCKCSQRESGQEKAQVEEKGPAVEWVPEAGKSPLFDEALIT
jgi:hypothetical protein